MGEHAVLHGHYALVCAINRRIEIIAETTDEDVLEIDSDLGSYSNSLETVKVEAPFEFILQAVHDLLPDCGIKLKIKADFDSQVGFGSSAAISAAIVAILHQIKYNAVDPHRVFTDAHKIIQEVQGKGSGADLAASIFGGIIKYRMDPSEICPIDAGFPLAAYYTGSKEKTMDVVNMVEKNRQEDSETYAQYFQSIDSFIADAETALIKGDQDALSMALIGNQLLMDEMKLSNDKINDLIESVSNDPGVSAVKISGSGLGDCIISCGLPENEHASQIKDLYIESQGLMIK